MACPWSAADLEHAPLAAGVCAAITMFHVLEHLYDPRAYLESARELLQPNGRLIVQVPNAACWQFRLLGPRWNGVDVPRHLTDFRARDLEALLSAAGFEVLRRKYFSLRDNPAGLASSLAPGARPHGPPGARSARNAARQAAQRPRVFRSSGRSRALHASGSGLPCRFDHHDRGLQEAMSYSAIVERLPGWLSRHVLHFEAAIEDAVAGFAEALPAGARVLDAGAGEVRHARYFTRQRYCGGGPGRRRYCLGLQPSGCAGGSDPPAVSPPARSMPPSTS